MFLLLTLSKLYLIFYLQYNAGNISLLVPDAKEGEATHTWSVYVRGPSRKTTLGKLRKGKNISLIISKVIFSLHPSFTPAVREISEPPFAVTEKGNHGL